MAVITLTTNIAWKINAKIIKQNLLIMSKIITLRKGLDINLVGKPQESLADAPHASEYALSPLDFEGVTPKLLVRRAIGSSGHPVVLQQVQRTRALHLARQRYGVRDQPRREALHSQRDGSGRCDPDVRRVCQAERANRFPRRDYRSFAQVRALAHDYPAALRYHRRPERHTEGRFRFAFDSAPLAPDYNFVLRAE